MTDGLILVVDDEPGILKVLTISLEDAGYRVVAAADGQEALWHFREIAYPPIVLTDIKMPGMDGLALLKAIKADDSLKHLPVLMVTAEARKEDIVLAAQSGAAGYIVKPFTKATLEEKVQKIMQKLAATA